MHRDPGTRVPGDPWTPGPGTSYWLLIGSLLVPYWLLMGSLLVPYWFLIRPKGRKAEGAEGLSAQGLNARGGARGEGAQRCA